jgi:hypothetical protein
MAKHQLRVEPLCRMCLAEGKVVAATTADHIEPHGGDINKFWLGRLQSLCTSYHSGRKQRLERDGFLPDVGSDGFPLDRNHPVYRT